MAELNSIIRQTVVLALLCCIAFASASRAEVTTPCVIPDGLADIHAALQSDLNKFRARHDRQAVTPYPTLNRIAAAYACILAKTGHFDHVGPDGSTLQDRAKTGGYAFCAIAENLARGQRTTTEVMKGWLLSDGHRRNMLLDGADQFGLGIVAIPPAGDAGSLSGLSNLADNLNDEALHLRGADALKNARFVWVLLLGSRCT